jgi:spore coat protein A
LTLGPGERADVIVDFSHLAGQKIILRNNAKAPYPKGTAADPRTVGQIMMFNVSKPLNSAVADKPLPAALRGPTAPPGAPSAVPRLTPTPGLLPRQLALFETEDQYDRVTPMLGTVSDGAQPFTVLDPITGQLTPVIKTVVKNGDTEVWEIFNTTADAHPIHVHLVQFQVLGQQRFTAELDESETRFLTPPSLLGNFSPPPANQTGWEDTVLIFPGQMTKIIARFVTPTGTTNPATGQDPYVWHCHILSHEEHDMMQEYVVTGSAAGTDFRSQPQVTYNPVPSVVYLPFNTTSRINPDPALAYLTQTAPATPAVIKRPLDGVLQVKFYDPLA